jgi:hypothetical protein
MRQTAAKRVDAADQDTEDLLDPAHLDSEQEPVKSIKLVDFIDQPSTFHTSSWTTMPGARRTALSK